MEITLDQPLFYVLYIAATLTPISTDKYVNIEEFLRRPWGFQENEAPKRGIPAQALRVPEK